MEEKHPAGHEPRWTHTHWTWQRVKKSGEWREIPRGQSYKCTGEEAGSLQSGQIVVTSVGKGKTSVTFFKSAKQQHNKFCMF